MPSFKDEHILIIAPGSQTTLAQLGLPESFTPAKFRFPTRMFPAESKGEWEPLKIRQRVVTVKRTVVPDSTKSTAPPGETAELKGDENGPTTGAGGNKEPTPMEVEEEQVVYEEDPTTDEGAVYPIRGGAIVNWTCLFALLTHIYNTLSPPFHTPIMLIAQPVWTARDRETLTQFIFEKFKTPAFCLMDSALAVCYAYGTANATIIDIGHDKADVTAVTDFVISEHGRGIALPGCGGEAMTGRLTELLQPKGLTKEMCEQLKKSNICEILPSGIPLPKNDQSQEHSKPPAPMASGKGPDVSRIGGNGETEEDDGIIDVAAIVSGNTSEFLARREKEKAEKAAARKGHTGDSATTTKAARLPNSKKEKAAFQFQEYKPIDSKDENGNIFSHYSLHKRDVEVGTERFLAASPGDAHASEHGSYGILDTLAAQIHHTIHAVPDSSKRSELWDSMVILGNGSKIRGFPQALVSTITQKYVLSPSSTIFTSEIPSALSTPLPTGGSNTPLHHPNPGMMLNPSAHGVNPLLVAATHANNPAAGHLNPNMHNHTDPNLAMHHRSAGHSQTPTSVRLLKPPEYFPEWKDQGGVGGSAAGAATNNSPTSGGTPTGIATSLNNVGMEEATFLGAQVAAKVIFVVDQGLSKGFLGRVEYNETGPTAIHEYSL
ncbi:Actin-like protein arp9 (SWI/SNF complex component arp9) [Ophidiomyces ophidiicola]|uniref:Actin-like protein arp9 (SWI/SNF complex component arp9) n=1 Tax=Ophidiomyces ophidiicola TaxID=1387563 RepID=A0ACB8UV85_9EURO|nr:Actin-like protein arp9 (SWI/SNF complex component arp9) [Ophidiomyces ophidiicola]KAI1945756.1 Actin-like protein arp9 (SWI/SNF complex component arp9) [Ophidiomyces ophidiicola]KAI1950674.1 Actin-like protein arp9 (SWI/SNF complex component arp9) [Ophidiomyces ophidiicola]KAI1972637.1 Actin-like protein arp9 (SWI/SNF complex component arp9) [Ophidiomyces ophidiicola]KAI2006612.1 Actin-like protein arp9 (SWI/SNF complex component arp9) [Ophidiomyces ophidiicola]KAI2018323.1 Actin-like prot